MEGALQEDQVEVSQEQKSSSMVTDDVDSVEHMLPTSSSSDDEDDQEEDNSDDESIPDISSEDDSEADEVISDSESEDEKPFVPSPIRRRDSIERTGSSLRPRSSPRKEREQNDSDVKRSVSFSTVQVYEHRMVLGDNPSVSRGLPVALDSKPIKTSVRTIDEFEDEESPHRRNRKELRLTNKQRHNLLVQGGHSDDSFRRVSEEIHAIKQHRKQLLLEDREQLQQKLRQGEQHKNPFYGNRWIYRRKNKKNEDDDDDDDSTEDDGNQDNPQRKPVNRFVRRYVSKEGWVSRAIPKSDLLKSESERQAPPRKTSSFLLFRKTGSDDSTKESRTRTDQQRNVPGRKPSFLHWSTGKANRGIWTHSENQGEKEANKTPIAIAGVDGKVTTASKDESSRPPQRSSFDGEESLSSVTKWMNRRRTNVHNNKDENDKMSSPQRTKSSNRFPQRYVSKECQVSGEDLQQDLHRTDGVKQLPLRKTSSFLSWRTRKSDRSMKKADSIQNHANDDPLRIGGIQGEAPKPTQRLDLITDSLKKAPGRNGSFFQRASHSKNIKLKDPVIRKEEASPKKKALRRTKSMMQRIRRKRVEV